jgi:hypothetical protein
MRTPVSAPQWFADMDRWRWRIVDPEGNEFEHSLIDYDSLAAGSELVFPVRRLAPDGFEAWKQVLEPGYEGYVAKDEASVYEGGATRRWLKVKQKDWTIGDERWTRRISVAAAGSPTSSTAP